MLTNKKVLIGIIIFVVIIIVAAGGFFVMSKSKTSSQQSLQSQSQEVPILQKLSSEDLGLTFTASSDKKKVQFSISKLDDIRDIDYEIKYDADASDEELADGSD